ncbi:MAG: class I SAM-dependent methyltransferase [Candidatus Sumerlaeota bacterium]|nr:class I SAM-dependent methyltransferase [Candidatus Sumerlaeota bacterium]
MTPERPPSGKAREAFYERFHASRGECHSLRMERDFTYREICRLLKPLLKSGDRVVDIGCGPGALTLYCAMHGCRATGYEISAKAVDLARKAAERFELGNVDFVNADVAEADLGTPADLAICSEVLEHLPNDGAMLERINSLLREGGRLFLTVPSSDAPLHRLAMRLHGRNRFDEEVGHVRRYNEAEIASLLTNHGFAIEHMTRREGLLRNWLFTTWIGRQFRRFVVFFMVPLVEALDRLTWPVFGTSDIVVVARKPGRGE